MELDGEEELSSLLVAFRAHNERGRIRQPKRSKRPSSLPASTASVSAPTQSQGSPSLLSQISPTPSPREGSEYSAQTAAIIARANADIAAEEAKNKAASWLSPLPHSQDSDESHQLEITARPSIERSDSSANIQPLAPSPFITEKDGLDGSDRPSKELEAEAIVLALIQCKDVRVDWDIEPHISNLKSLLHTTHLDAVEILCTWYPCIDKRMLSRANGQYGYDVQIKEREIEREDSIDDNEVTNKSEAMGSVETLEEVKERLMEVLAEENITEEEEYPLPSPSRTPPRGIARLITPVPTTPIRSVAVSELLTPVTHPRPAVQHRLAYSPSSVPTTPTKRGVSRSFPIYSPAQGRGHHGTNNETGVEFSYPTPSRTPVKPRRSIIADSVPQSPSPQQRREEKGTQSAKRRRVLRADSVIEIPRQQEKAQQEDRSAILKPVSQLSRDPMLLALLSEQKVKGSFFANVLEDKRCLGLAPELRGILCVDVVKRAGELKRSFASVDED